jgi:O-antigen/teichoic acid export membrane protein
MFKKLNSVTQNLSPTLRKILGNTAWLFGEKMLQMVLGLLIGVWVARYLGTEDFGRFNYALAFVGLFGPIATLGLGQIVVRDLARNPDSKDEILGTAFILKFLGGLLTFALTVGAILYFNPQETLTHWLVAIVSVGTIFLSFETIDFWFQSKTQSKYTVWSTNSAYVIVNVVKVILIQLKASLIAFTWTMTAEKILASVALVITYKLQGNAIKAWRFSWQRAKHLLGQSWPLILSGFVIMIYMRIDQVMLGQMRDSSEVGVYSAAVKIAELWYFIPGAIIQSVFPSVVQAKDMDEQTYYGRIQKLLNFMAWVSYAVAIPMTLLSDFIVDILYGPQYAEAAPALSILVWAGLFVSLGLARGPWLITEGLMRFSASTTAVGAVINVIFNFLLIPQYGGLGAGIATVIAQFFAAYGANAFYPKTRIIFFKQTRAILLIDVFKKLTGRFN